MVRSLITARLHKHDLAYLDSGEGPTVLFIHGLLGSNRHWASLMTTLGADHRVLAPDLFGHGASDKPMGDYSLGAHAATLRDLLDLLEVDRVTLVGHSLGGGIALQFCYLFPERVNRLVLVSSGGLGRRRESAPAIGDVAGSRVGPAADRVALGPRPGGDHGACPREVGVHAGSDVTQAWQAFTSLGDADAPPRIPGHDALGDRPRWADRHGARPPADGARHPHPDRLGNT